MHYYASGVAHGLNVLTPRLEANLHPSSWHLAKCHSLASAERPQQQPAPPHEQAGATPVLSQQPMPAPAGRPAIAGRAAPTPQPQRNALVVPGEPPTNEFMAQMQARRQANQLMMVNVGLQEAAAGKFVSFAAYGWWF